MKIRSLNFSACAVPFVLAVALFASTPASADPPSPSDVPFDSPPSAAAPAAPPASSSSNGDGMRTGGWISFGAGLATLAVGITCFIMANADDRQARDKFAAGQTPSQNELHAVDHWTAGGVALSAAGVLAMGAGVTLVLLAPRRPASTAMDVALSPRGIFLNAQF